MIETCGKANQICGKEDQICVRGQILQRDIYQIFLLMAIRAPAHVIRDQKRGQLLLAIITIIESSIRIIKAIRLISRQHFSAMGSRRGLNLFLSQSL
jgi:hypothetical protein